MVDSTKLLKIFDICNFSLYILFTFLIPPTGGAYNAKRKSEKHFQQEINRIDKLLTKLEVLSLDAYGEIYGDIKYTLERKGLIIDEFDIIIADHAISEGLTLVTDNLKHFGRIEGLKVENWMAR